MGLIIPSFVILLGQECFSDTMLSVIDIPHRVVGIPDCCFTGWTEVMVWYDMTESRSWSALSRISFEMPSQLERIGCDFCRVYLNSRILPPSLQSFEGGAFSSCRCHSVSLASILRFRVCNSLLMDSSQSNIYRCLDRQSSVVITASVSILGEHCFAGIKSLQFVRFEPTSRVTRIEEAAFRFSGLKGIVIPATVTVLCRECFYWCSFLTSVNFELGSQL
jgi:hypothetical protein